jgi:hypothetical protein
MEAARSFETLMLIYQSTECHKDPDEHNSRLHRCEKLKFRKRFTPFLPQRLILLLRNWVLGSVLSPNVDSSIYIFNDFAQSLQANAVIAI